MKNYNKKIDIGYFAIVSKVHFGNFNVIYSRVTLSNVKMGNYVYVATNSNISNASIGSFCSIGPNVSIGLGIHPVDFISTFPAFYSTNKQCLTTFTNENLFIEEATVVIGNDVWIGAGVIILDNISIGDGAIIGAGAVVTKDVEPYSIVGGIPAIEIRKRFSAEEITELLKIKWWNNDDNWLQKNYKMFSTKSDFFRYF